jgi:hypothetical protein
MSEPKRYTAAGSGVVRTDPEGDLVLYVDYLRLLIEVDELKSQPDSLTAYLYAAELAKDDIKRLKAKVERLTNEVGLMNQLFEKHLTPEIRKALVNSAKDENSMWGVVAPYVVPPCIDKYTAKEGKPQS